MLVADIGHIAFRVPDVDASVKHMTEVLGMYEVERVGGTAYVTVGSPYPSVWPTCNHHVFEFSPSTTGQPEFDHIGFIAHDSASLAEIRRRAVELGVEIDESTTSEPGIAEMLRLVAPTGHVVDVYAAMETVERDYVPRGVMMNRLAHAFMWTEDIKGLIQFFVDVLGFKVSDWVGDPDAPFIGFARCHLEHHTIAIGAGPAEALHHYALEMVSTADLGRLGDQLARVDNGFLWGIGRHGGGDNVATYHLGPEGLLIEVYADMQKIAGETWQPRFWSLDDPRSGNLWGEMPGDFASLMGPSAPIVKREPAALTAASAATNEQK
jgi:catechol 2,3-dioxygenase